MEIEGTHQFDAPVTSVWDALLNPSVLAKAMPGGDQLERVGENDYKAAMNVRVGPVQGRFEGQVTLTDIVVHKSYRMKVSGTGAQGFLNGEGALALAENDGGTLLTYTGDVQVGGRIASVGQRLIDSTAKSIIRQGLKTLDEQLQRGETPDVLPPAVATEAATTVQAPTGPSRAEPLPQTSYADVPPASSTVSPAASTEVSTAEFGRMAIDVAKDVAQDLVSDYVPREKQPQLFAFIAGALAMLLFVVLVRLVQRD
jgi:carbon monoxide dehydrogenase subunit G